MRSTMADQSSRSLALCTSFSSNMTVHFHRLHTAITPDSSRVRMHANRESSAETRTVRRSFESAVALHARRKWTVIPL